MDGPALNVPCVLNHNLWKFYNPKPSCLVNTCASNLTRQGNSWFLPQPLFFLEPFLLFWKKAGFLLCFLQKFKWTVSIANTGRGVITPSIIRGIFKTVAREMSARVRHAHNFGIHWNRWFWRFGNLNLRLNLCDSASWRRLTNELGLVSRRQRPWKEVEIKPTSSYQDDSGWQVQVYHVPCMRNVLIGRPFWKSLF